MWKFIYLAGLLHVFVMLLLSSSQRGYTSKNPSIAEHFSMPTYIQPSMATRVPMRIKFQNLRELVGTPCGLLQLEYYDDLSAPDELTILEHIVFSPSWGSPDNEFLWALPVCNPSLDGHGCGLKDIVRQTRRCQLWSRLWGLSIFNRERIAADIFYAEVRAIESRGGVRTGFESGAARYAEVAHQRAHAQFSRKIGKQQLDYISYHRWIAIAEGEQAEEEQRRRGFQHAMTGLREELLQATRQGDVLAEIAASRQMKREQLNWGFDLGGNPLDQATRNTLTRLLGLSD